MQAQEILEDAARKSPEDPEVLGALARASMELGDWESARASWMRARELDPWNAAHWVGLGQMEHRRRHLAQALAYWNEAIRIDPLLAAVYFDMAAAYVERGEERAALDALEKFQELRPESSQGLLLYGRTLVSLGHTASPDEREAFAVRGRRALDRYLVLNGQAVEPLMLLGLSYAASAESDGDRELELLELGSESLKRAVYLSPGIPELHHNLGVISTRLAERWRRRARKLSAGDLGPLPGEWSLTRALSPGGRRGSTWSALEAEAPSPAQTSQRLELLTAIRETVTASEDARRFYRRALEADPLFLPSLENLAILYSEWPEERARALELIERAQDRETSPVRQQLLEKRRRDLEAALEGS